MSDIERRAFLELELGAIQQLYHGEKTRRETVRTSLAIPFASVTLIILALGTLTRLFPDPENGDALTMFSGLSLALAAIGALALFGALWVIYRIDYASIDADGLLLDLSQQAASIEDDLDEVIDHPDVRQAEAEFAAIQGAIYAYDLGFDSLRSSNDANLVAQKRSLNLLLGSIACMFLALFCSVLDTGSGLFAGTSVKTAKDLLLQTKRDVLSVNQLEKGEVTDVQASPIQGNQPLDAEPVKDFWNADPHDEP